MNSQLRTKRYLGFASLPQSYASVFETGSEVSFFLTRVWFENFAQHIVPDVTQLRIYGVECADGSSVAVLPMMRSQRQSLLAPAALESLSNYYTCFFGPIIRKDQDAKKIIEALTDALWEDRRSWDVLSIKPAIRDSAVFEMLVNAFRMRGTVVQTYACFGNWYLEVGGRSFANYVESRSSILRKNIPYNIRRLERTGRSKVVLITSEPGLETVLDDYEKVYNASWKIREASPQFIRGLALLAARNGWLRLGLVYIDGEPAAAQLWIVYKGTASIYKVAYDERFAKLSVGTVLTAKLMKHVIDVDKVDFVDYLSGEDEYKKLWMSHRREYGGVLAFNPRTVRGLGQIAGHLGTSAAKKAVQKIVGNEMLESLMRWRKNSYRPARSMSADS